MACHPADPHFVESRNKHNSEISKRRDHGDRMAANAYYTNSVFRWRYVTYYGKLVFRRRRHIIIISSNSITDECNTTASDDRVSADRVRHANAAY